MGQSVANLTSLIVVSNALAPIVTTDVRYLPSGIFGRPPIYDVCCEAPSLSCDPQSFSGPGLSIIHCRGGKSTWSDLPNIKPTHGFNAKAHKSKPPPVEPTGASNKVYDERRAPKPGGPSRTLQYHESRSRAALQSCCRIGRFSNRKPRPRRKRLRLSGQVRLWAIRQLGFLNEIQRTFVFDSVT